MNHTKLQIDAQRALRSRSTDRSKRAVFASQDALHYRYEGQQFSDLSFPTFIDLFVALTGPQLSTVAKVPGVIQARSSPKAIFDDGWYRLYRDGWERDPVSAALVLIGLPTQLIWEYSSILTRVEAGHWALKSALNALEETPSEVVNACDEHVAWVKNALCKPFSAATQPSSTTLRSSRNAHRNQSFTKIPLSEMDSPSDVENPETPTLFQKSHEDSGTCSRFVDSPGSHGSGHIHNPLHTIDSDIQADLSGTGTGCGITSISQPLPSNILASNLETLFTSRTIEPNINPAVLQPIETDGSDRVKQQIWSSHSD
jgi:hypothetical protein